MAVTRSQSNDSSKGKYSNLPLLDYLKCACVDVSETLFPVHNYQRSLEILDEPKHSSLHSCVYPPLKEPLCGIPRSPFATARHVMPILQSAPSVIESQYPL